MLWRREISLHSAFRTSSLAATAVAAAVAIALTTAALSASLAAAAIPTAAVAAALTTGHGVCIDDRSAERVRPTTQGGLLIRVRLLVRACVQDGLRLFDVWRVHGCHQHRLGKDGRVGLSGPRRW